MVKVDRGPLGRLVFPLANEFSMLMEKQTSLAMSVPRQIRRDFVHL